MTSVFVSYKAEDRARVKPLVDALVAQGLGVWWDLAIESGARWREAIQAQLDVAACVVVVWSAASAGSDGYFVQDEAAYARRRGVYLPIVIDPVEPPLGFRQEQTLNLEHWRGDRGDPRFLDLLAAIRAQIAGAPGPKPMARETALRRGAWRRWSVAAALFLVLAVAGTLILIDTPRRLCLALGMNCAGSSLAPSPPPNSIAVLPLSNLSGDPSEDYFSDGLSDELISALSRLNQLQVIGRMSSFKFKGSREGAPVIGAKLGVAYLLYGTVRREGRRVRVSAELSDTKTGFARWSATYDRNVEDVFAVQSGIAEAVAQSLKVKLASSDIAALNQAGTSDPGAYDAFLRARGFLQTARGEADDRRALADYDDAIAADPHFAKAHAGRAIALMTIAGNYLTGDQLRAVNQSAVISARRAVALAPDLPATQAALGDVLLNAELDVAGAGKAYDQAWKLGPGEPNVLIDYGLFRCQVGDCAAGLSALRRAVVLDPLDPIAYTSLGRGLLGMRRYVEATQVLRHALQLSPGALEAHAMIGNCLLMQGRLREGKAEYDLEPLSWARLAGQAIVLRRLGEEARAGAALSALSSDESSNYQQAQVRAQWGDVDGAFAALDGAIRTGDAGVLYLRMDPLMDPLRRDVRFTLRLIRLGILSQGKQ